MRGGQIGDAQTAGIRARREIVADPLSGIRQLACRHRQDPSGGVSGRGISSFCRRTSRKISVLIFAPFFSAIKPMGKVKAGSSPGDCPWRKIRRPGFPISGSAPVAFFAFPPVLFPAPYTKKGGTSGGSFRPSLYIKPLGEKGWVLLRSRSVPSFSAASSARICAGLPRRPAAKTGIPADPL